MIINTKKYGSKDITELDNGYLQWVITQGRHPMDVKQACQLEVQQRLAGLKPEPPKPMEIPKVAPTGVFPPQVVQPPGAVQPVTAKHTTLDSNSAGMRLNILKVALELTKSEDLSLIQAVSAVTDYVVWNKPFGTATQAYVPPQPAKDPYLSELNDDDPPFGTGAPQATHPTMPEGQ